jgi:stearoyl-CoA desaturase (delta-9 desaturase)
MSKKPWPHRIDWFRSVPFFGIHVAAAILVFTVPFSWKLVALAAGMYYLRMFAITAGYHRYFSHRTYKIHRISQFLMAFLGATSTQKGALWWASQHRHHHKHSDEPEDIHSPIQTGFLWSHMMWMLSRGYGETRWELIPDLAKYPELRFLDRQYWLPPLFLAVLMYAVGGMPWLVWGFGVSTVFLWHGTFTINSLSHVYGSQRYRTSDTSRNNFWFALITMGEGWHNNHHTYMSSTRQGFFWWEVDASYYMLKALSWIGVTRDLREPPLALLEAKRIRPRTPARAKVAATQVAESVSASAVAQ